MITRSTQAFSYLAALTFALSLALTLDAADSAAEPSAAENAEPSVAENAEAEAARRIDPMDTTGFDYGIANILRNYYRKTFTDAANWEQVESIRYDGAIHFPEVTVSFTAFKKKPDLVRVILNLPGGGRLTMAYDGSDAWQQRSSMVGSAAGQPSLSEATTMPAAEARNFIRDATTGSHLLYPLTPGKTITLEGTQTIDGQRAYHLRVILPDGQQIQYFLDMTSFAEIRQININNVSGDEEVTTNSDFNIIDGIRVPFTSTLTIDGRQVHQSHLDKVRINLGVMPWMFARPSSAELPSSSATPQDRGSAYPQALESAAGQAPIGNAPDPAPTSFGAPMPWQAEDIWAPSVFIDPSQLSAQEIEALSKQVD